MPTIKFYTLGCKVNQYDTQAMREQFLSAGYQEIDNGLAADNYLINTCTVTHRADSQSVNLIRRAKRENSRARIIVTGCLTELDRDKIKIVDKQILIVRNKDKARVLELAASKIHKRKTYNPECITFFKGHTRAFLKIQDGCNNSCSYCKVPLVRGRSRSKPLDGVVSEARQLVKNGFKEIVLTGICLGSYGRDLKPKITLVDLINELEKIEGLLRIRLSSIEAKDVEDSLISKIARSNKLCRHLHIPIQSGDDGILKEMNRKYSRWDYLRLVKKIKKNIVDIAITTDVLVGFPAEEEENFQHTLELVREIVPLRVHIFPYSSREGTSAFYNLKKEVPHSILKERIFRLKRLALDCATICQREFLDKEMDVLVEGRAKERPNFWEGYTSNYIRVIFKGGQRLQNKVAILELKEIIDNCVLAARKKAHKRKRFP